MKIPKSIVDKIGQYEKYKNIAEELEKEIEEWFDKNDDDGIYKSNYRIVEHTTGEKQSNGEYCDQWGVGCEGDSFEGIYYIPIKGNKKFIAYDYYC